MNKILKKYLKNALTILFIKNYNYKNKNYKYINYIKYIKIKIIQFVYLVALIKSAALSAMTAVGVFVFPEVILGIIEASTTLKFLTPKT